jgi:two-component system, OmpR family, phosphate regulon sensor histidine kinase PhoR
MENKAGFRSLICICVVILTGSIFIQCYLLRNTYKLNLANYHNQIRATVLDLYISPSFQKVNRGFLNNIMDGARKVRDGLADQRSFRQTLERKDREIAKGISSLLTAHAAADGVLQNVSFLTGYSYIEVRSNGKTIIRLKDPKESVKITAMQRRGYEVISMGQNNGSTDQTAPDDLAINYTNHIYLVVPAMPFSILEQLLIVGSLSLLLLTAVVLLFYRIIRSAQRQTRITELREDLVNNITHELKTPLSSMAIAFKTLHLKAYEEDRMLRAELLLNLERQHRKLTSTVERVLESSVEREHHQNERTDIVALLYDYKKTHLQESHELQVFAGYEACEVAGISAVIEAAIDDLVENAQKYSPAGSVIQIIGKKEKDNFRIDVIDEGIGIDPVYQKLLFEKFFRVPQHYLHSVQGLGLGLFLSRRSLKGIGGDLQLTVSSPKGSIFTIYLTLI